MTLFSLIERKTIYRLFGIGGGYIFKYWSDKNQYNKNDTRDIILDSCEIDIYNDKDYSSLSQQKCVEKIFNSDNPKLVSNLLKGLCGFWDFKMDRYDWDDKDCYDYQLVQNIIERLQSSESVNLPEVQQYKNIDMLAQDIEHNISNGTPELVLDRLHTYAAMFLREICDNHNLPVADDKGNMYSIDGLAGKLKGYYSDSNYCKSKFSTLAIKTMISLFAKFNDVRNDNSFAHPNDVLEKAEAEYVVKTMLSTLQFITKIEEANNIVDEFPF